MSTTSIPAPTREGWNSRFGAIMSMAGMAIGLGNVWRFPYLVGKYGGGTFVFAYLVCLGLIVLPLAIVEAGLGKGIQGGESADAARERSIASGDFRERDRPDRSVRGKRARVANAGDLELVARARRAMGDRPVVVVVRMHNPAVLTELEPLADAVVVDFGVSQEAVWDLVRGAFEPSGLLPVRLPASMEAVERHCEDLPFDYEPYTDSAGRRYDFGYGLSWAGVIEDERTRRYTAPGGA